MTEKKKISKTQQKVNEVIHQAKESLKLLGTFEKEAIAKARSFVKIPTASERKQYTNAKILSGLKKLGIATQDEVEGLHAKIQKLEAALHSGKEKHRASSSVDTE